MSFDSFDSETSADGKKKGQKKAKKSNKSKAAQRKNSKKATENQAGNDLSAKVFATMEKHKEVFFVIRLHSAQSAASLAVSDDHILVVLLGERERDGNPSRLINSVNTLLLCSLFHNNNSLFKIPIRS